MTNVIVFSIPAHDVIDFLRREFQLVDICQKIIEQRIIHQTATERGIEVSREELEIGLNAMRYEQGIDQQDYLIGWLDYHHVTLAELQDLVKTRLLAQKIGYHLFSSKLEIILTQEKSFLDAIVLYKLVVPYEHLAQELFYKIEEEEISFFEAAHIYDVDENRRRKCGYEGYFQRRDLPSDLAERLFNAKIGELIGPIKTDNDFYELFWIDELIPSILNPILHRDILNQLFEDWMAGQVAAYLASAATAPNE